MEMRSCIVELGDCAIRNVTSKLQTPNNSGKGLIGAFSNSSASFRLATRVLGTSSDLSKKVIVGHTCRLTSVIGTDIADLMPLRLDDLTIPEFKTGKPINLLF